MIPPEHRIYSLSENSLVLQLSPVISEPQIRFLIRLKTAIQERQWSSIHEIMVTFHELSILFDSTSITFDELQANVLSLIEDPRLLNQKENQKSNQISIPVCYDEEMALDKDRMTHQTGMSFSEIVELHQRGNYLLYMLGFLPGFMYLGGLDQKLFCPRLEIPRQKIEVGSIGIADDQTGIYPMESPGGWNIIGRTPLTLFEFDQTQPFQKSPSDYLENRYLQPLDKVRFISISRKQFEDLRGLNLKEFQEAYPENS